MKKLSALEPTQRRAALKPGKPEIRQNYYPVPIFSSSWSLPFNCKSSQSINNPDRTHSLGNHGGRLVVGSHGEGLGVLGRKHLGRVMLKKLWIKKHGDIADPDQVASAIYGRIRNFFCSLIS